MGALDLFFGFGGRINRGKYWLAVVVWSLIWIVAIVVFLVSGFAILGSNLTEGELPQDTEGILHLVLEYGVLSFVVLALLIISWISALALGIKRLHDRDRSGWWILLLFLGPPVLGAAQASTDGGFASLVLGLGAFAISIWMLVELGFLRGTNGPNRFGPDPLKPEVAVAPSLGASKPAA
jgi:uncharacterized membrane protein YhaH (DUF805 family)